MSQLSHDDYAARLNLEMLEQYFELVGIPALEKSVTLFSEQMPLYYAELEQKLASGDRDATAKEAHKIKGAASSVGLLRVQQVAQQAQHNEEPGWDEQIAEWVAQIGRYYPEDIQLLKRWLAEKAV